MTLSCMSLFMSFVLLCFPSFVRSVYCHVSMFVFLWNFASLLWCLMLNSSLFLSFFFFSTYGGKMEERWLQIRDVLFGDNCQKQDVSLALKMAADCRFLFFEKKSCVRI